MVFYEEEKSSLEKIIGRRFPLAMTIVIAIIVCSWQQFEQATTGLLVVLALIGPAYFKDVGQEKQSLRLVPDETMEAYVHGKEARE